MTAPARYPVLARDVAVETLVQRSRFLATLARVDDPDQARAVVERLKAAEPQASHHCHAWVVGPPGSTAQVGQGDAGEPHGTAGRPMLDVLLGSGLGDVVAVVTRWFGGTKLGRGGLARAYAGAVTAALEAAERTEKIAWIERSLSLGYAAAEALRRVYPAFEAELLDERFGARVVHRLRLPAEHLEAFTRAVADRTAGDARLDA